MSIPLEQLRLELKSLPRDVLVDLVHSVLDDEEDWESDVEDAWAREAHRRWEAYRRGEEKTVPLQEAIARLRARPRV